MTLRTLLLLFLIPSVTCGATWHVDNRTGNDESDGKTPETAFATIAKAVAQAKTSDTISLADTGIPYPEPILLAKLGGTPQKPFTIEGNGAVLSGLKILPADKWEKTGDDLYFYPLSSTPYGQPYLASAGKRLAKGKSADSLAPEHFHWDRESGIHFRCAPGRTLASYDLGAPLIGSGVAVASASYIVCRNLTCEYFTNDGFNIHGDCRGIYLENVVARHNGDDGISIHESGGLVVRNAHVHHNTFGLQDVNTARSFYNGVLAEHNRIGASFHGGFYSLVDCRIRDNTEYQIDIAAGLSKHLIGSEHNPFSRTTLFAGNVVVSGEGSLAGLRVGRDTRAVVERSVFANLKTGILIGNGGFCHLTASAVVDCGTALASDSSDFFRDYNVYHPARMKWLGVDYEPGQWEEFRKLATHDENSRLGPVDVAADGIVTFPEGSPAREIKKPVGPSAPVLVIFSDPAGATSE